MSENPVINEKTVTNENNVSSNDSSTSPTNGNNGQIDLQSLIDSAPSDIKPQRDLWRAIEPELTDCRQTSHTQTDNSDSQFWQPLAIAASFACVCLLTWQLIDTNAPAPVEDSTAVISEPVNYVEPVNHAELVDEIHAIAKTHQQQVSTLEHYIQSVSWQDSALIQGLSELRLAAEQTQKALEQSPANQQLWQLWLWLQQRELRLLKQQRQQSQHYFQQQTQGTSI
ncbi:hypothetical protein EXU30_15090 [Shewanella maritima]|uniref:Uncharacterized protein n=1 Tax=Shewanella maritima TaxID=2520507 RepID=A0A411PK34_9GAMM|nr:hypothetical protein [Shewanella maritima]QBF83854.1 hypothetical protein EXU30_15090 [Shewanella maritima]